MPKKRILIVEDERDVAMLMQQWLEGLDYEIQIAVGGADALKRIYQEKFDLVLMDYGMRDIKGDRVCLIVKEDDKMASLPVVIVTGHIEVDEKVFREYGATDVLYKPVERNDLIQKVEGYLKHS